MKLCTTKCHKCKQQVKNRTTMDKATIVRTIIEQRRTEKRNINILRRYKQLF